MKHSKEAIFPVSKKWTANQCGGSSQVTVKGLAQVRISTLLESSLGNLGLVFLSQSYTCMVMGGGGGEVAMYMALSSLKNRQDNFLVNRIL